MYKISVNDLCKINRMEIFTRALRVLLIAVCLMLSHPLRCQCGCTLATPQIDIPVPPLAPTDADCALGGKQP